jgi:chlorite dismutase
VDPVLVTFVGGESGSWSVDRIVAVSGAPVQAARRVAILEGWGDHRPSKALWVLRGVTSHDRYVTAEERKSLAVLSAPLGRPASTAAALIPIRKSAEWWALPQDERRAIFEERSHHIAASLGYLPRIARRLHHGRDLGEPFDFITWFEFAPADSAAFDELCGVLRATAEWSFVEREVEIRLTRIG